MTDQRPRSEAVAPTRKMLPQRALVLLFHKLDDVQDIGLPFRRPAQHLIEDRFTWSLVISGVP
jgi:hypothetical protein